MPNRSTGDAITIRLGPELRAELDALAQEQHRNMEDLLGDAVAAYLDAQRRDLAAIREGLRQADAGEFATDAEVEAAYAKFG